MDPERAAKATILVLMLPETGALNATFRLARTVAERRYRIVYLGTPEFRDHVLAQGFEYVALDLHGNAHREVYLRARGELAALRPDLHRQELGQHYGSAEIAAWLDQNRVDLVLLDPIMWRFSAPFLQREIPILGLCTTLAAARSPALPPVFSDVVPDPQWGSATRHRSRQAWRELDRAFWRERRAYHGWRRQLRLAGCALLDNPAARLVRDGGGRLVRHEYGYKLAVPEVVLAPRELDFPRISSRLRRCYAGACVDPERRDGSFPWDRIDDGKPLAYGSLGTYGRSYRHRGRLLRAAVEAFRQRPDWQLILQTGGGEAELAPLPPNVVVARKVPQLEILERASLAITHGGFSSVREAIYYAVPMIVFPCWYDQPGNAARVVYHHLGVRGDVRTVNAEALLQLVRQVTGDDSISRAVTRMQKIFRQQTRCTTGAGFVDRFLVPAPGKPGLQG